VGAASPPDAAARVRRVCVCVCVCVDVVVGVVVVVVCAFLKGVSVAHSDSVVMVIL